MVHAPPVVLHRLTVPPPNICLICDVPMLVPSGLNAHDWTISPTLHPAG